MHVQVALRIEGASRRGVRMALGVLVLCLGVLAAPLGAWGQPPAPGDASGAVSGADVAVPHAVESEPIPEPSPEPEEDVHTDEPAMPQGPDTVDTGAAPRMPGATIPRPILPVRPSVPVTPAPQPSVPMPAPVQPIAPGKPAGLVSPSGAPTGDAANAGGGQASFRPSGGETQQKDFDVNYEDTDLIQIVKSIGAMTGRNFDIDPQIGSLKVTIVAHRKISADMAYAVLESILSSRGYTMLPTLNGDLVKIVPTGDAQEKPPLVVGADAAPAGFDTVSTHIVPVNHADVTELQSLLPSVGSKNAQIRAYAKTNTLIITDNADGIRNVLKLLKELDVPGYDARIEIFPLEYTRAEILAQQVLDVLGAAAGTANPAGGAVVQRPVIPQRPGARPAVPGQPQQMVVGTRQETLQITPDERMNALIVKASDAMMERVRDLIKKLDKELPYEANNMNIVELQNADAEKMEQALNAVIGTTPRQGAAGGGGAPQGGGAATAEVQPFEKKVIITKYERTNALLILASPQDFKVLRELIARLDIPTRQVHVEAIIMDVIIGDKYTLSVESTSLKANDAFALNNVVKLANILQGGVLGAGGVGTTVGVLSGTTKISNPAGTGGTVTIPNIPLLISMLQNVTNLDILSQPSLTTIDNEKAEFIVGQEVPFITGSSRSLDQTTVNSSVFSNVNREDVGIKLNVTPQISQGDNVLLDLGVEVSQTVASDIGADVNIVGPTVQKSKVANKVTIMDGCTGVIAGLVSESTDRTINQTPVLGDVPVLGWLFRSKASNRSKRNLAILVTPNIVRQGVDLERMTQYRMDEFDRANIDVLFEKGFIKKVRQRADLRENYRPSATKSAEFQENKGKMGAFSQGKMRQP